MVDYQLWALVIFGTFAVLVLALAYLLLSRSNHYPWSDRDLAERIEGRERAIGQRRRLTLIGIAQESGKT